MKRLIYSLIAISMYGHTMAQTSQVDDVKKSLQTENKDTVAWVHSGLVSIGANEGFLHNWAAGGELASLIVNGVFHGNLTYLNHADVWSNTLDMTYGLNYTYSNSFIPRKTDDRIDLTSQYGMHIKNSKRFYLAGLFNFKSQFTKGYDYSIPGWEKAPTSNLLSPGYLTLAVGAEYRKGTNLDIFLSPIAAREIFADLYYTSQTAKGAFGIDSGKTSKFQFGAYFSGKYSTDVTKKLQYATKLDLYSNYLAKDVKDATGKVVKQDNPGNIQVLWDNLMILKAYKALSLTFGVTIAYDNNFPFSKTYVDKTTGLTVTKDQPGDGLGWVQVKQIFTFGLAYKL